MQVCREKDKVRHSLHSEIGKQRVGIVLKTIIIWLCFVITGFIIIVVFYQLNDISTMLERKDYHRAFNLIYKQALRCDSISMPIQDQMRRILIEARAIPGLPDSVSLSGEEVEVDENNGYAYIIKNDSIITYDIRNRKRYAIAEKSNSSTGKYKLSKLGNVLYKDNDTTKTFIQTKNLTKRFTTNVKSRDWRFICSERFVAICTDSLLYLYDLDNDFVCKSYPARRNRVIFGQEKDDKYFSIADNTGKAKVYILPDFVELSYDKPYSIHGFVNNQLILDEADWEKGNTHLANINENFEITASYHGLFSCLSNDQKSVIFTTDKKNVYWWSLHGSDFNNGSIARSELGLEQYYTYSSKKFAVLRSANKMVLDLFNDYNIPAEFGRTVGVTDNCVVFSNDGLHITRIVDPNQADKTPITISHAWPSMISSGNRTYLSVSNTENGWKSDSTSIYNGLKRIATNNYFGLHVSSDYVIVGGWEGAKTFKSLIDENEPSRSMEFHGYFPGQLNIIDGWLFAVGGTNLKVYNFLTLEELILKCDLYTDEQKKRIVDILRRNNKFEDRR